MKETADEKIRNNQEMRDKIARYDKNIQEFAKFAYEYFMEMAEASIEASKHVLMPEYTQEEWLSRYFK